MPHLESEPSATVASLEELFAVARAMEEEAIAGYRDLARRMHRENRPGLAAVFEQLVAEETMHLDNVSQWSWKLTGKNPDISALRWDAGETFDDEGAATVAPELLTAYRAFSIAVRNEERAFAFWTYVAANSPSDELREAAETVAREELEHVATLRRERRRAFHAEREASLAGEGRDWTLAALESRLAALLNDRVRQEAAPAQLDMFADQARERGDALARAPLGDTPLLRHMRPQAADKAAPLAEFLLDCYLDLGERAPAEEERDRAQIYAAQMLDCLPAVRQGGNPAAD